MPGLSRAFVPLSARTRKVESLILLCDHGYINGGQAEVAIESALNLKQHGLDVCVLAGVGPLDPRLKAAGIECHVVADHDILDDPNRIRAGLRGLWNVPAARALTDALARRDPRKTVIHVHGWAKALSPSIGAVVARAEAAHVYTLHEYFLGCPNGGFYDYRTNRICTRRALGSDCLTTPCDVRSSVHKAWRVARQVLLWSAGSMPRGLREIIYLAPQQRDILGGYIPPEARWHFLPNPVEPSGGMRVKAEDNDKFLFVGRFSPEKGASIAAAAAKAAGVPIAFCGQGPEAEAIVRAEPDAQVPGWLDKSALREVMRGARALVVPSLWYETFGLVVADALRSGLPVIVSASSVAANLVVDGVTGLHAPAGDVDSWAAAMTQLKSHAVVRRMSEAAFEAGRLLLDHDEHSARLITIYDKAIECKHGVARAAAEIRP